MKLIARRLLAAIPLLLTLAVITFCLGHLAPGDPISVWLENGVDPRVVETIKREYGLDKPILEQLGLYLAGLVQGNLGYSYSQGGRPVLEVIGDGWLVSFQLGIVGITIMIILGLSAGLLAASHPNGLIDWLVRIFLVFSISVPSFVLAYAAMWTLGVQWRILPIGGWGTWQQMILPSLFLGLPGSAYLARQTRAALLEVLGSDYIRTARAKGLGSQAILLKHALRNGMLPIVTVLGPTLGGLIGGFFFIENIFAIPGIGRLSVQAVFSRDYPLLQAIVLMLAISFVLTNLLVDLAYLWIDPRISR